MASSNAPASKARELQTGDVVGNYVIVGKLGQGGMGAVYRAKHRELNREAAIKLLTGEHAHSPEMIARFLNEAKIANQVQHAGVVQVYETGRLDGGEAYMVMELLAGETLLDHLRAAAKSGQPAMGTDGLWILRQIAGVMAAAHQSNVVHRDLKPSNIILVPDPEARDGVRVKILDFGIAKFMTRPDTPLPDHLQAVHTKTGVQIGTAPYMSPELWIASKTLDDRVDVYALGVIAYQVLANDWPFPSKANWEFVHRYEDPRALKSLNATLPDPVCALFERALAKLPAERPTMAEIRDELVTQVTSPVRWIASVRAMVARGLATLKKTGGGSSGYAARAMVLVEPPSIDAGEITDKGYINQRLVLTRRADLVMRLHADQPDKDVIVPAGTL